MTTTNTTEIHDISYFTLRLNEYLSQSYPELQKQGDFVEARSSLALETYGNAIRAGQNHLEASHLANNTLFTNLPFSKMDMLFEVICEEFYQDIPDDKLRLFAEQMYPSCLATFDKYDLTTNFKNDEKYDSLYTELTGVIQIWWENTRNASDGLLKQ